MDRYKKLDNIANSIHAASRINSIRNSRLLRDDDSNIKNNNISTLYEILDTIAHYSPQSYRDSFSQRLYECKSCSNVYRDLKQHLKTSDSRRNGTDFYLKALETLAPVLGNRERSMLDKIRRIYEIINS